MLHAKLFFLILLSLSSMSPFDCYSYADTGLDLWATVVNNAQLPAEGHFKVEIEWESKGRISAKSVVEYWIKDGNQRFDLNDSSPGANQFYASTGSYERLVSGSTVCKNKWKYTLAEPIHTSTAPFSWSGIAPLKGKLRMIRDRNEVYQEAGVWNGSEFDAAPLKATEVVASGYSFLRWIAYGLFVVAVCWVLLRFSRH